MPITLLNTNNLGNFQLINNTNSGSFKLISPTIYADGLYRRSYEGYFADNVAFFASSTVVSESVDLSPLSESKLGDTETYSDQWLGYFKPTTTENYTLYILSDDASYLWIGDNALSGFTTVNATINNGGLHGNIEKSGIVNLTAGIYYPIRMQFGENTGGDIFNFNYSTPTITKTTDVSGKIFYKFDTKGF